MARKVEDLGRKFNRPDLERIGLFVEMPYVSGKVEKTAKQTKKLKNFYTEGAKSKNGTQHGYFDKEFNLPIKQKNVSERPFLPPTGFRHHSTPGDYYGTFSGIIEAFSNKRLKPRKTQKEGGNLLTNPGKKGGYGYVNICLNPYPEHKPDRYGMKPKYKEYGKILGRPMVAVHFPQPFFNKHSYGEADEAKPGKTYLEPKTKVKPFLGPGHLVPPGKAKLPGGCYAGCFDKWPQHLPERKKVKTATKSEVKIFYPPSAAQKSYYNTSILNQAVDLRLNEKNFKNFAPTYTAYIVA